jgi:hypothetical protein
MDKDEALKLALVALKSDSISVEKYEATITAVEQALALDKMAENARELGLDYEPVDGTQVSKVWWDGEKLMAKPIPLEDFYLPVQEPVAWVDLLKQAEEVVRSKSLWKKYIDGTPLANDIAVWMASFAQEHTTPPAAQRQWVGMTDEEITQICVGLWSGGWRETAMRNFARAIEAKLKEKNT